MKQSRMTRSLRAASLAFLVTLSAATLYACSENKGPMEKTGEKIDETLNDAKRTAEDAAD